MNADLHGLAGAYALDALDDVERAEFEAHLSSCAACTAEVAEFGEVATALADSSSVAPPTHLKATIMSQLGDVPQDSRAPTTESAAAEESAVAPVVDLAERRRKFSMPALLGAAAAVALIAIGAVVISANRGGSDFDDVLAASDAVVTQLDGEGGTFEVAYSAELDRVALRGENVDDLGPGLRYALWAIADGTPIPAGLFEPDDGSIEDVVELADVAAEAWGITVEPESGSASPTLPIISIGEV